MNDPIYDDSYRSCSETFATLAIRHDDIRPADITVKLNIEPSKQIIKGEYIIEGEKIIKRKRLPTFNGWFLSSKNDVASNDCRRHIDWIVDQIHNQKSMIHDMIEQGFKIDICSFWVSKSANGGPTLSPYQMRRLSDLNIEVWWDIYFDDEED